MGAGKTTAAEQLAKSYDYRPACFAGPIKDVAAYLWGPDARLDRDKVVKVGESMRVIDRAVWMNLLFQEIGELDRRGHPVVVDDCRRPREFWGLAERGFVTVRIHAPEGLRVARLMRNGKLQDRSQLYHETETALDDYPADHDIYVEDDDLPEFEAEIDRVARHVIGRQP